MEHKIDREFMRLLWFGLFLLVFFCAMLLMGTYYDEAIAKSLYSPDNLLVKLLTSILGAHYLSDVSAGAIIGSMILLVYFILQRREST
jgi:membrane-associated phospholipid phosphatase